MEVTSYILESVGEYYSQSITIMAKLITENFPNSSINSAAFKVNLSTTIIL